MNCKKSFLTNKSNNFSILLIMNRIDLLFIILRNLMAVSIMFGLAVFPMHDEMDKHSLEKDVIISPHAGNFVAQKPKKQVKHAAHFYAVLGNTLQIFSYKPKKLTPLPLFLFFVFFHSFCPTILRL